jgi:hypothetical protein
VPFDHVLMLANLFSELLNRLLEISRFSEREDRVDEIVDLDQRSPPVGNWTGSLSANVRSYRTG